jgi:hypothetical protein
MNRKINFDLIKKNENKMSKKEKFRTDLKNKFSHLLKKKVSKKKCLICKNGEPYNDLTHLCDDCFQEEYASHYIERRYVCAVCRNQEVNIPGEFCKICSEKK